MNDILLNRLPPRAAERWSALLRCHDARRRALGYACDARRTLADDLDRLKHQLAELRRTESRWEWAGVGGRAVEVPPPTPDPVREQQLAAQIEHGVGGRRGHRSALVAEAERVHEPIAALVANIGTAFAWPAVDLRPLPASIRMVGPHGPYDIFGSAQPPELPNTLGLLAWASPSLLDAMLKEIEATAPTNGLSNAARAARLADLARKIHGGWRA